MRFPVPGRYAALGLSLAFCLCGCSGEPFANDPIGTAPPVPPTSASSTPATGSTGAPSAVPTVTLGPDQVPGATTQGHVSVVPGVPPGFPRRAVPLFRAPIAAGSTGGPDSDFDWSVVLRPTGSPARLADAAGALLKRAGYVEGHGADLSGLQVRQFSNGRYAVGITVARHHGILTMTYTVSKQ